MPYIKLEIRESMSQFGRDSNFQESVELVINHLRQMSLDDREGPVTYAISRIVAGAIKPQTGWRYKYLNRAYGTFFSAAAEFSRRLMTQYEDKCIKDNGDLPEYETF